MKDILILALALTAACVNTVEAEPEPAPGLSIGEVVAQIEADTGIAEVAAEAPLAVEATKHAINEVTARDAGEHDALMREQFAALAD